MYSFDQGRVVDASGSTLFAAAVRPRGFVARLRGLLGRPALGRDEAWWFGRCNTVHTLGMRVPIDVVHLDHEGRILKICAALAPQRWSILRSSTQVLELASGSAAAAQLKPGLTLRFIS